MILFIDGSDITRLTLGRASINDRQQWQITETVTSDVRPEGYLAAIDNFIGQETIASIIAVTGPGSATALRASLAIVNAISLAQGVSLYGVDIADTAGELPSASAVLLPTYHHDPVITVSTRDSLLRTL